MEAKDALWEVQRLMALLGDPEPINFVLPSTMIPGALMLDTIMLLTGNWLVTALLGGGFFDYFSIQATGRYLVPRIYRWL
jgi:hypothetical protein